MEILRIREEQLNRYRIQYLPLCCEEDMERLSEYFGNELVKN